MANSPDPDLATSSSRFEDFFDDTQEAPAADLLGTLRVTRPVGSISVVIKSSKLSNCRHNWKKFLFTVLPASAGAIATIPTSSVAAAIIGLQAIKAAIEMTEIEFSADVGLAILHIADIQRKKEAASNCAAWVSLVEIECRTFGLGWTADALRAVLADLDRLGVVRRDLDGTSVRVVEELRFEA